MPESLRHALAETGAPALVGLIWATLLPAVVCLWSASWAKRLLVLQLLLVAVLSLVMMPVVLKTAVPIELHLGSWLSIPGEPDVGVPISYRFDSLSLALLTAIAVGGLVLQSSNPSRSPDELRDALLWVAVAFSTFQFVVCISPALRFAFWHLTTFTGLIWAMGLIDGSPGRDVARRVFLMRFAADGCLLLGIMVPDWSPLLLSAGILGRCIAIPLFADGRWRQLDRRWLAVDAALLLPLVFLWAVPSLLCLATGGLLAVVCAVSTARNADSVPRRYAVSTMIAGLLIVGIGSAPAGNIDRLITILTVAIGILATTLLWALPGVVSTDSRRGPQPTSWETQVAAWIALPVVLAVVVLWAFERFTLNGICRVVTRLPERIAEQGEPLRNASARFYVVALLLATAALLGTVVGFGNWR